MANLNDLAGFPIVLAMSEQIINYGLKKSYATGTGSTPLPVPAAFQDPDGAWQVSASFGVPQIDFNTDVQNGCRLKIVIVSGSFSALAIAQGEQVTETVDLTGVVFYFTTPVGQVRHTKLSDNIFDVHAIFADLTQVAYVEVSMSTDEQTRHHEPD